MRRPVAVTIVALVASVLTLMPSPAPATQPDPLEPLQWALDRLEMEEAWSHATGDGVVAAVIDTGVSAHHPEFEGRFHPASASWFGCPSGAPVPCTAEGAWSVDGGHGTWVAGILAAGRNGLGSTGIAPDVEIMALRAVGPQITDIPDSLLAVDDAIVYAVDHGADVINISLGGPYALAPGHHPVAAYAYGWPQAIEYAFDRDVFVAVAAGNGFQPICENEYFAVGEEALCVGASTREDERRFDSDWGVGLDVLAPGGGGDNCAAEIVTTGWSGSSSCGLPTGYTVFGQTSSATPHVVGVAALLAELGVRGRDASARIIATADDLLTPGWDPVSGWGRINARRAVTADVNAWPPL